MHCENLTKIVIRKGVTNIGENCFYKCENLVIYTNNEYVKNYAIENNINYVVDTTGPSIVEEKNPSRWTNNSVTLTLMVTDEGSRSKRSINR